MTTRVVEEPSIDGFRDDFAELVSHDQMKELRRVVVVVDDLDRCLSDTVIAVLEAIKLFLSVPKMAFLVAADETAVKNAIAVRYGSESRRSESRRAVSRQDRADPRSGACSGSCSH